jgi:hypothetical protein
MKGTLLPHNDYLTVRQALDRGDQPDHLCLTCRWDRTCIEPPEMTKADVEQQMQASVDLGKALAGKAAEEGRPAPPPLGLALLTAAIYGVADMTSAVCPVLALRLQDVDGHRVAKALKQQMQTWNEQA